MPIQVAEKLVSALDPRGDLDEVLERLRALKNLGALQISGFERSLVADAQDGLG